MDTPMQNTLSSPRRWFRLGKCLIAFSLVLLIGLLTPALAGARSAPRERISLNNNWRFTQGDPTNNTVSLLYDVRQPLTVKPLAEAEADGYSSLNAGKNAGGS